MPVSLTASSITALGIDPGSNVTGWGVVREKPEYEDLARIAREKGLSISEVAELVRRELS